ncbi:hypothetical protein H5410_017014 [Solanum commersonii]|uniref:RRM domain-containing protein n=1 Tax=Solanum commersonii TaxID=4109 RepID=A0A9J5ZXX3_SOLCO|nr:hypothetical protein H5410_017014 [Solanum commersonii]
MKLNGSAGQCPGYIFNGSLLHREKERMRVFSAFGFVHKITTFEKTAGFQALVQFSDAETATSAKDALDGRSIPSYLIPELGPCTLKITYSAHTDLSVKFQSHRSRDYTNSLLPVASSAIDSSGQFSLGLDGKKLEPESNVLLASIENMQYAVTLDVLYTVFSAFGPVLKIAMFDKNGGLQALIQYPDVRTAAVAKEALEGHSIYQGGYCMLHISYSRHTDLSIKRLHNPKYSNEFSTFNHGAAAASDGRSRCSSIWCSFPVHASSASAFCRLELGPATATPSMPMQMHNHPYMPAASMPSQMGPGMMPMHGQNVMPHSTSMPPYHPQYH